MKRIFSSVPATIVTLTLLVFLSCKKSDQQRSAANIFTWTIDGTNYTANFRNAYSYSASTTPIIVAGMGNTLAASGTGPSITIPSFNEGICALAASTNYYIHYIDNSGAVLESRDGYINITAYSNNHLSGNFSAVLTDASSVEHVISGNFTEIPVNQ